MKSIFIHALLVLLYILCSNWKIIDRVQQLDSLVAWGAYLILFVISFVTLFVVSSANIRRSVIILLSVLVVVSSCFGLTHEVVTDQFLSFQFVELAFQESSQISAVLGTYYVELLVAFLISLSGFLILLWHGGRVTLPAIIDKTYIVVLAFVLPVLFQSFILYKKGGKGLTGQPYQISTLTYFSFNLGYHLFFQSEQTRKKLTEYPEIKSEVEDIILVVDESIKGNWLDINVSGSSSSENSIPTNLHLFADKMFNYGVAASTANCSASSNLMLRTLASAENPVDEAFHNPYIWEYAKNAGYKTIYLDGQFDTLEVQNYMTRKELNYVDLWRQFSEVPSYKKDQALGFALASLLNNSVKEFIYIQKMGAHFPYGNKFPNDSQIADDLLFKAADLNDINNEGWLRDYKNAVQWNVSQFFHTLKDIDFSHTFLIYTADHGQFFNLGGRLKSTHCNAGKVHSDEGIVPLFIITENQQIESDIKKNLEVRKNRSSSFDIGPTLIKVMGYNTSRVSLFDKPEKPAQFISNFYVRFGEKIVWNSIAE